MDAHGSDTPPRASGPSHGSNYWQLLAAAADALLVGDFPAAERRYRDASDLREASPGRRFVTEKLGDGLRRLFSRDGPASEESGRAGRWSRASREFVDRFRAEGESVVREGVRRSELRPEDDAEANQPILESALFLVARSRLFEQEPGSAVPLLKGLFRTASRTGRPFSVDLVRHDLPLTEEDRLWLARKGGELVAAFIEQGHLRPGSPEAEEWAEVFLQLLQARYFGATGRLEEERAWLEALTADRLLARGAASVGLYRAYLLVNPEPGPRADEARVRMLELLGNIHGLHFPIPRYDEALRSMQSAGLAPGSAVGGRYEAAIARFEYRRPEADPAAATTPAWASVALERDGRVAIVFWWDNEPRDLAFWSPGEDAVALEAFLAPCEGRLVAADAGTLAAVADGWSEAPAPWTVGDYVAAILESRLPADGLADEPLLGLALAETGPWRAGWRSDLGHADLEPPHSSSLVEGWQQGTASAALVAGLQFLAVRSRVAAADLALRAGIGEMARRGDAASAFLYGFLTLDSAAERAVDAAFEAWTLPLLWTRPDPFGWGAAGSAGSLPEAGLRPDLGRSDLTIVTTGHPADVIAAWGEGKQKWRVVLDRLGRLETLSRVAGAVVGPITLIPPDGRVHDLAAALSLLDDLIAARHPGADGLLALFHWTRLVETHNGDLLDFRQVRPRAAGAVPLHDRYAALVAGLGAETPGLAPDGTLAAETLRTWAGQFSQRVRKAGLVAGTAEQLSADPHRLDSLWGVFEGSDASWVFLDSAAVHWSLLGRGAGSIQDLHALLHSRGGRHLSLLSAGTWQRTELEELLATWLHVFGSAYCLGLTDTRAPILRLVDRGVQPEAIRSAVTELAGQVTWIERRFAEEGPGTVRLPVAGRAADFWRDVRSGDVGVAGDRWHFLGPDDDGDDGLPRGALVVPVLHSLESEAVPVAADDTRAAWGEADEQRLAVMTWRRGLCALEIAALLAGPWRSVDVLDTRWWRLLRPGVAAERAPGGTRRARAWDGEQAAQLATAGQARTFDLPLGETDRPTDQPDPRAVELVAAWLARRGEAPPAPAAAPQTGVRLLVGELGPAWNGLTAHVAEAWERGRLASWILLVADRVPPGAADLVAAGYVAGRSVWRSGSAAEGGDPAPILWVQPEDFADPALRRLLAARPPAWVVADDLADWLPGPEWDAQETAQALRAILDLGAPGVLLRARALTPSWAGFLAQACGVAPETNTSALDAAAPEPEPWPAPGPCVDCGHADRASALARRLRGLLARLRPVLAAVADDRSEADTDKRPEPGHQLLPLDWLGRLAGLDPSQVAEGVLLLRWAARLNGDALSAAAGVRPGGAGHTLLVGHRFAELEPVLERLGENLAVLMPLWLEGGRIPGLLNRVDLEQPPVRIPPRDLARVDAFLAALAQSPGAATGLVYHAPRGLLNEATRLVGWDGSSAAVVPAVMDALDVFRRRIRDVLASALETADGFRVETGLAELRDEERAFFGLGVVLGFWRWLGPPEPGAIHLVDLLTAADSPTVQHGDLGWDLYRAQAAPRLPALPAPAPSAPEPDAERSRLGPLRKLLSPTGDGPDDLEAAVLRVHEVTSRPGEPAFLMLRGMIGTGRHEALVRGLLRTWLQADDPGPVTVWCPDEATAARVGREFLVHGYPGPLDIRVPTGTRSGGGAPLALPALAQPHDAVVVMCEVHRFDAETRYRVAQQGRGKLLVMTADPVASSEPWEHLFLTTPRANDIVTLEGQRRLGKAMWREVRALAPEEHQAGAGTSHGERGQLESGYAANLVQSVARIVAAQEAGALPTRLRVTASLTADLDYVGGQLRERGWLVVPEQRLDGLLLPGPREILAALTDGLGGAGELALRFGRPEAGAAPSEASDDQPEVGAEEDAPDTRPAAGADYDPILPRLLGRGARGEAEAWLAAAPADPSETVAEFVGRLIGLPWANTFLRHRDARRRCEALLDAWGAEALGDVVELPLWEAWWQVTTADLGLAAGNDRRPLVLLNPSGRPAGAIVPGGVYLCHGTESARQHYEVLGRLAEGGLVLYQERSPLPGDAPAP